jgi:hypothetical protein
VGKYLDLVRKAQKLKSIGDRSDESDKSPPLVASVALVATANENRDGTGIPYARTLGALRSRCPDYVPHPRWGQALADSERFVAEWGPQAQALEWSPRDLWGLHKPPDNPASSYSRLSRYDETGLLWLLQGRQVTALSSNIAAIKSPTTGSITKYRKDKKPALGPLGDSLDDFPGGDAA